MRGLDHGVAGPVDALPLLACVTAEKEEDHAVAAGIEGVDDGVCEALPPLAGVGAGLGGPHGQDGVEEEEALARPGHEVAVAGDGHAGVVVELAEQIAEGRWRRDAGSHGEGEAVGLPGLVIGVLAQEDGAHGLKGSQAEGLEDLGGGGVDSGAGVLVGEKGLEPLEVRLLALMVEGSPTAGDGREGPGPGLRSYGRPPGLRWGPPRARGPARPARGRGP
jgi:hypothetical protein